MANGLIRPANFKLGRLGYRHFVVYKNTLIGAITNTPPDRHWCLYPTNDYYDNLSPKRPSLLTKEEAAQELFLLSFQDNI